MASAKTKRFSNIKDELQDFHPLLMKLLPRLPRVTDVEYTQGQHEMGADFVLARQHDTFKQTEYIGVVVKVGGLVQSFAEVERQIDECCVPRLFRNGKEKIRIDEIWVALTGYATKGAQEKIHEKYKNRKIVFIDGQRLEGLIDQYLPTFWHEVPLESAEYLASLKARNLEMDRSVSLVHVEGESFYIEQDVYTFPRLQYRLKLKKLERHIRRIEIFDTVEKNRLSVIEGAMGSGKSKLVRQLVDHYSKPETYLATRLLPIQITYKEFAEQFDSDVEKLVESRISSQLRKTLLEDTKFLLLIDGVDEKNMPAENQIEALRELAKAVYGDSELKAVITSRYLRALDETNELESQISRYNLSALSLRRTIEFITAVCKKLNLTDRLIEDLKRSPLFKELPRSPIAAILLAKLINENSKDLPSNLTELYAKYVELMLGRWDIEKGLQSQKEYQALDNVLMNLARYLIENELVYISIDEAKKFFESYLRPRNLDIDADALFDLMVTRTELVLIDEDRNVIAFKHRTFAEFFYAKACLRDKNMHIDERAFQLYWMNSFFFYLGLQKDAPEVLRAISNVQPHGEAERWLKVMNMANFFMAAYATPYEVIEEGVTNVMLEAADLYKKVIGSGSSSPFAKLPRMHFLFLFQYVMRHSYAYGFFAKALESAALEIGTRAIDETLKAYALFFLNVAYIDTGSGESFDFLLKEHVGKLPLDLSLAYRHESKNTKERTTLMKKQDKRVKRLLKHNQGVAKAVEALYENPLGSLGKAAKALQT